MKLLKFLLLGMALVAASSIAGASVLRKRVPAFGGEGDPQFSVVAVMDGAVFESRAGEFVEARATALMGGIQLDLTGTDRRLRLSIRVVVTKVY
jgi:hypothetical protein